MNKASKRYYRDIRTLLPTSGTYEKKLLQGYRERLLELNENNPDITYDSIEKNLGSPTEVINGYYATVDVPHLIERLDTRKRIRFTTLVVLILAFTGFILSTTLDIRAYFDTKNAIIQYEKCTIVCPKRE